MPKTLTPLVDRQCTGKRRHFREEDARAALTRLIATKGIKKNEKMNVYQCPFCSFWHFGHGH